MSRPTRTGEQYRHEAFPQSDFIWSAEHDRPDRGACERTAGCHRRGGARRDGGHRARGLAIATIDGGKVRTVGAWGARNANGDRLTPDTVMYGASLTKAVFGYFVTQLAAEKRLDLDKPIAAMLPRPLPDYGNLDDYGNWGDLAGDDRWRAITPRMVLNHATGFANFAYLEPDEKLRIHFAPGTHYAYSGEGISLLQFGIEQGLGLDVEAELQRRFFGPLGMTRTSLIWQAELRAEPRGRVGREGQGRAS